MDYSLPGSSVHGISQARILEWVAISFFRDLPDPGIEPASPALGGGLFTTRKAPREIKYIEYKGSKFPFFQGTSLLYSS